MANTFYNISLLGINIIVRGSVGRSVGTLLCGGCGNLWCGGRCGWSVGRGAGEPGTGAGRTGASQGGPIVRIEIVIRNPLQFSILKLQCDMIVGFTKDANLCLHSGGRQDLSGETTPQSTDLARCCLAKSRS